MDKNKFLIGMDVGSTTVKAIVVNEANREIVWSDYQRHKTKQAEKVLEFLQRIEQAFPDVATENFRIFATGSGAKPLVAPLGALFVQEVNAVTLAVEQLFPEVGSVVELGGQDAKIIIFNENEKTGEKQAICSMNDKCASGTGATIDKCMIKVGLPEEKVSQLQFDASKLHKVAAKCGVFAETDIVNLIKSGIPSHEVMCSLGDAIVSQNLSVLTRGNTLKHKVLLLGGPNTYLSFLQQAWRLRIIETWQQRHYAYPKELSPEELILVPENALYFAAHGAIIYGLDEPAHVGLYKGIDGLQQMVATQQSGEHRKANAGPALIHHADELDTIKANYSVPLFQTKHYQAADTVRAVIGLDGGSTSSKAVLVDESGEVIAKSYKLSEGNPIQDMKDLLQDLKQKITGQGAQLDIMGFGATGYAADVLQESVAADVNVVETIAHMMSAVHFFKTVDVICDIGGQDIKVLFMQNGDIKDFRLSNQCSAGNGMLLQAMADQFAVPITQYAQTAFKAKQTPIFSYGCAVFLDSDRVNFQKEGYSSEELLAGLAMVLPKNVWQYVVQIPRMAELGKYFVLQGGTQYNLAAVKAQVDYIQSRVPEAVIRVHPHCGEAGAIGAAIETLRVVKKRGHSTFIGLEHAIALGYETRTDESTRCHFCPNHCTRTFIDTKAQTGHTSRYISGFSCEKGTVESKDALRVLVQKRKELKEQYVNLVEYEARLAFKAFYKPQTMPDASEKIEDIKVYRNLLGMIKRKKCQRLFNRSSDAADVLRRNIRIGIPRVLNLYSTAPLFRTYFESLGIPSHHICFSDTTSEEMFQEGAKYGSIDPCFPSKVVQAHMHYLLFKTHEKTPLNYIFFPSITHMPTFVEKTMGSASCPIVAGTPNVMKAAFTKEKNFFAERNIEYIDICVNLMERNYLKKQMFETWGQRLNITEDESDFAMDQAWQALAWYNEDLQRHGMEILEQAEKNHKVVLLVLNRPYHADPGLNHEILEEFQALGYPVLSINSVPKDPAWLSRWFKDDLAQKRITTPLEINDVWPENYSTNSVQKVWAAKFAARHPNVAVLDLSSFKCGHDAPTYGLIDEIIKSSKTPYMALHDLDANKPAGSLKIRVKTFAYTLMRYQENLFEKAKNLTDLEKNIEKFRAGLLQKKNLALQKLISEDAQIRHEHESMKAAFTSYLEEDKEVFIVKFLTPPKKKVQTPAAPKESVIKVPITQITRMKKTVNS
jgi:predicted CoA-substrate-specific enzyme activase